MAEETERPQIIEVAFAAALNHRDDVIGVPQGLPPPSSGLPVLQQPLPRSAARVSQAALFSEGVDAAGCADSAVAQQDLFAQVSRLRAQLPLVHAVIGTEGITAARDFQGAPAA